MLKPSDLTAEERALYMPKWKKILIGIFVALIPIVGSIETIAF